MKLPSRLFLPLALSLSFLVGGLTQFAPSAMPQANVSGQWQTLPYTMPINPVHTALLYTGKVLIVSGSGNDPSDKNLEAAIWDPQAGTITTQPLLWDMFCNGMVVLPDGRPLVLGGTLQYDPFYGQSKASIFDPASNAFSDQSNMEHGRWYPTATALGDGRVMVFSGSDEHGSTNTGVEFFTVGAGWSASFAAPWTPPLYPRMNVLPDGTVFYSGSSTVSNIFNPTTTPPTWKLGVATHVNSITRSYGSSVLLPLTPSSNYKPSVMILGGGSPSTATTEIIDLSAASPKWVSGPNMSEPRIQMNATILPNGKILANGGSLNDEDTATASLNADIYDPNSNTFSSGGTEAFARLYHSVSLLLPDATVWVAGSNPVRGTFEPHMEIYSPPYLFNADGTLATRPTISSVSASTIGYGSAFQVSTPDAASISTVVLMRNGAVTHSFNMDQRYVGLSFTAGSGVLNVTAPPNGNIAPPGYYMLFLLNNVGVPSVASMVQVSLNPGDAPPTGTITTPASNPTILSGQSVSYSGTGTSPGGTISAYSWIFEGGNPSSSNVASPGNVTYSTPGTYNTSLTVTDNLGVTDPHPPTRTVTVNAPPDFSLAAAPSSESITPGGSAKYTATVTDVGTFTGTVSFGVTGLPAGATGSFAPATMSGNGSSTLTITTGSGTPLGTSTLTITGTSGSLVHSQNVNLVVSNVSGGSGAISIDFVGTSAAAMAASEVAGVDPKSNWNGATGVSGSGLPLVDETGTLTGATVTWSGSSIYKLPIADTAGDFRMMNGYLDASTQNTTVTVAGLPSNAAGYDIFVYADGANGAATRAATYQISGTGIATTSINLTDAASTDFSGTYIQANNSNGNYVTFSAIPGTGFTLTAIPGAASDTVKRAPVNGMQIFPHAATDFSIAVAPASQTVAPAGTTTYTVTIGALNGFTGTVTLSASGLPAGATASFTPPTVTTSGTSTMTVTTGSGTPTGTSTLTITGTSGALTHSTTSTFVVSTVAPGTGAISIDFVGKSIAAMAASEVAGVVPKSNWNEASTATGTGLALVDESGTGTGATVSWTANSIYSLPIGDAAGDFRMMNGYLDASTQNTTVTVASLPSNAAGYDVYVYADGANGTGTRAGTYQISGTGITTTSIGLTDAANTNFSGSYIQANNSAGNYVKFTITATGFTLTAIPGAASDGVKRASVNGIQIVPH